MVDMFESVFAVAGLEDRFHTEAIGLMRAVADHFHDESGRFESTPPEIRVAVLRTALTGFLKRYIETDSIENKSAVISITRHLRELEARGEAGDLDTCTAYVSVVKSLEDLRHGKLHKLVMEPGVPCVSCGWWTCAACNLCHVKTCEKFVTAGKHS